MLYTVLDVETTGRNSQSASPVSCSYITFNKRLEKVDAGIMYFYHETIPESDPGAFAVHGLSKSFLKQYASDFETNVRKLYKLIVRGNIVGHNAQAFDVNVILNFLGRRDYSNILKKDAIIVNSVIDTMKIYQPVYHKKMKLINLVPDLGITEEVIETMHKVWFGRDLGDDGYHTANKDTVATALVFCKAVNDGLYTLQ